MEMVLKRIKIRQLNGISKLNILNILFQLFHTQNSLGVMYYEGRGTEKNLQKPFELFEKSAKQGSSVGQFNLGKILKNRDYVAWDLHKSFEWFEKSATQGHSDAKNIFAEMYYNGL